MAYTFRYSLSSAPEPRQDGSGCVDHDIWAQYREDAGAWGNVPGRHKTVSVPAAELEEALGAINNPAIVLAYKTALAANLYTQPVAVIGWSSEQLLVLVEANDAAEAQATAADEFITVELGLSYPVPFNI